jgi:hypothetical protein
MPVSSLWIFAECLFIRHSPGSREYQAMVAPLAVGQPQSLTARRAIGKQSVGHVEALEPGRFTRHSLAFPTVGTRVAPSAVFGNGISRVACAAGSRSNQRAAPRRGNLLICLHQGRASSVVCPSLSAFRTFTLAREATAPQPLGALIKALDVDGERVKAKVRRRSAGARFSGSPIEVGFRRSAAAGLRNKLRGSRRSAVGA